MNPCTKRMKPIYGQVVLSINGIPPAAKRSGCSAVQPRTKRMKPIYGPPLGHKYIDESSFDRILKSVLFTASGDTYAPTTNCLHYCSLDVVTNRG